MATSHDEQHAERTKLRGMQRALAHAIDMNQNGRLEAKELDEFRRYLIGESIDGMSMDQHMAAMRDGSFDRMWNEAGQSPDEEQREPREMKSTRDRIASKIVADYLGQLWDGQKIDDKTYIAEMQKIGMAETTDKNSPSPDKLAPMIYAAANGMEGKASASSREPNAYLDFRGGQRQQQTEESSALMPAGVSTVSPEEIAEFEKRNTSRGDSPSARRRARAA